jgi:hypothetical protein
MITLSGMGVDLDATIINNDTFDPNRDLDFIWSANPSTGVVFTPDEFVSDPTVTITDGSLGLGDPNNPDPNTVELTLSAWLVNPSGPNEKAVTRRMYIDVYSDACKAQAAAVPTYVYDSTDFNTDCTTDFKDIAITGAKWLDNYQSTGPAERPVVE